MAVRIRLTRVGATKRPSYRVVAIDSRRSRDGRALEILGFYDPLTDPATVQIDADRLKSWMDNGATPSDTVVKLMRQAGIAGAPPLPVPAAPKKAAAPRRKAKATKAESTPAPTPAPAATAVADETPAEAAATAEATDAPAADAPQAEPPEADAPGAESTADAPAAESTEAGPAETKDTE